MSFGEEQTRYEVKRTIRDRKHGDLRAGALPSPARVAKWSPDNVRALLKIGYLSVYGGQKPCDPDPSTLAGVIAGQSATVPVDRPPSASVPAAPATSFDEPRPSVAIKRRQRREKVL
jgi:hypothetical protein